MPRRNLVPKPVSLSFEEAACLPTSWLTAYRMLFTQSGLRPGDSVLIQGAGGGVSTALVTLARAAGLRSYVTSRDESKEHVRSSSVRTRYSSRGHAYPSGWTR